jgi:hypothetical protein
MTALATVLPALRPHRFTLRWVAGVCLVVAVAAVAVAIWLATYAFPADCLDPDVRFTPRCAGTSEALDIDHTWAGMVMVALTALPFIAGIVLGGPLVAAEVEAGTASTVWWLEPTRRSWLLVRVVVFGALLLAPALAGDLLERFRVPRYDPATTVFLDYGSRGALLVARGLATFVLAVLLGLITGRVLPGMILAGLTAIVMFALLDAAQWLALPGPEPFVPRPDGYVMEVTGLEGVPVTYLDRDGTRYTSEQLFAEAPAPRDDPAFYAWYEARGFVQESYGISGERLWPVQAREVVGLAAGSAVVVSLSAWLVGSRRPY